MTGNKSSKLLKITEKNVFFHRKKTKNSDAKNRLSLSSLVLSEQIPLKWAHLKKSDLSDKLISKKENFSSRVGVWCQKSYTKNFVLERYPYKNHDCHVCLNGRFSVFFVFPAKTYVLFRPQIFLRLIFLF